MKVLRIIFVMIFLSSITVNPALADELTELKTMLQEMKSDYETRISELEAKINAMETNQQEAVNQRVAQIKDDLKEEIKSESWHSEYIGRDHHAEVGKGGFMIESPTGFTQVSVGGYMDHEFENFENTDSTFDQHRWILNVGANIGDRLRFQSEYEIEHGGPDQPGGEAKVEQAFVDYLINDGINIRLGAVLAPFGRTNIYHDSDLRDLTARSLVARDIIPTTWTESGVGLFGEFEPIIGDYEDLVVSYEAYVVNGLDDGFTDTGMGGAKPSLSSDNNNNKALVGRVVLSPALGHEIGFSAYHGDYNDSDDSITGKAIDFSSTWGPFEFIGELARFDVEDPIGSDVADVFKGYSLQGSYHFWPEFLNDTFLGRRFEDPTFTLVGRYGWIKIEDDSDAGTGDNEEDRFTLGINYRPVESWVFKVEHQWNETENESLERGDNNGWFASVAMGF